MSTLLGSIAMVTILDKACLVSGVLLKSPDSNRFTRAMKYSNQDCFTWGWEGEGEGEGDRWGGRGR